MEKRAILAVLLSFVIIVLYQVLFAPPATQREKPATPDKEKTPAVAPAQKEAPAVAPTPQSLPSSDSRGQDVVVETDLVRVVFTTRGGQIKKYLLKNYRVSMQGEPIDMVRDTPGAALPLYLEFPSDELSRLANEGIYAASRRSLTVDGRAPSADLVFSLKTDSGLEIQKRFRFQRGKYQIETEVVAKGGNEDLSSLAVFWGPGLGQGSDSSQSGGYEGPVAFSNEKLEKEEPVAGGAPSRVSGEVKWAALQNKYFLAAFLAQRGQEAIFFRDTAERDFVGLSLPPGERRFSLFVGPKEHERLEALGVGLERVIDYGWFSFLAKPLLDLLRFLYGFTKNYGVAIILLTVVIKVLFSPLTHKSFKSMQKMQALQPQIKRLQQLYKNDKQRLNQEVMSLYRERKLTPMGGCFPMLLQIPVFFALYRVLLDAIELRHTPFFWWITDLSAKDPYYVWPILMGISMVIQQKMTPSAADPMQAKIMMLMPIVFTIMFLNFPVGLVIYWLVNNVLTIAQQYFMNWQQSRERAS
ncbi:MAG: membrane protein insertase YidC [Candidatus Tectomicrobia bacterium]|uniref:Membrane protein insertase YidC n=1 Tax=Tectimicrobiota bacterium TaxID=2528274 RepID=A0A932M1X4_UNCTE|nr:membrane protein insertase YidC [Candidatus Tectomicrobia bacterium]